MLTLVFTFSFIAIACCLISKYYYETLDNASLLRCLELNERLTARLKEKPDDADTLDLFKANEKRIALLIDAAQKGKGRRRFYLFLLVSLVVSIILSFGLFNIYAFGFAWL